MNPALADTPLPAKVKVVCSGAIIFGGWAFLSMLIALTNHRIDINFAGLLLPAGLIMLTVRSNPWRICTLVLYWIFVVGVPLIILVGILMGITNDSGLIINIQLPHGTRPTTARDTPLILAMLAFLLLVWTFIAWSLAVLHDPRHARFFRPDPLP